MASRLLTEVRWCGHIRGERFCDADEMMKVKDYTMVALLGAGVTAAWWMVATTGGVEWVTCSVALSLGWATLLVGRAVRYLEKQISDRSALKSLEKQVDHWGKEICQQTDKAVSKAETRIVDEIAHRQTREMGELKKRMERSSNRHELMSYLQIESLIDLHRHVDLVGPLRPLRGYAASPDYLRELVRLLAIDRQDDHLIVDLGSGMSTVVMASMLRKIGRGKVVAIDHEKQYADATRDELRRQHLTPFAEVIHCPLTNVTVDGKSYRWYGDVWRGALVTAARPVTLISVDGPPKSTGELARFPALPQLWNHMAGGCWVAMDDSDREDETEIAARWEKSYSLARHFVGKLEKGMVLFSKNDASGAITSP